jgi:DNA-binding MarR family transcriptional regulator
MAAIKLTRTLEALINKPGKKHLSHGRYAALLRVATANGLADKVGGLSPGGAAAELDISRQAVHRAIDRATLDAWYVSETGEEHGARCYVYVTTESVERYKISGGRRA